MAYYTEKLQKKSDKIYQIYFNFKHFLFVYIVKQQQKNSGFYKIISWIYKILIEIGFF